MYQQEENIQTRHREQERAIQLAMANRWEEAARVNRAIIQLYPNDSDSYNRLGKALMELARFNEAKKAYKKTLELDPNNQIAKKNLDRLGILAKAGRGKAETARVDPTLFIEEMGKSTITILQNTATNALAKLNAGDRVELHAQETTLAVETARGKFVGAIEPKLGLRLIKLMQSGNQYAAAITSLSGEECHIIIKETHQDPSLAGRPSFPAATTLEGTRPYTKQRLIRYESESEAVQERDEAGLDGDGDDKEDWEKETEVQEGDVRLYDAAAAEDSDDDELEE